MADIQFERRGLPLWKVLLGLLVAGAAAFGGYEAYEHSASGQHAPAPAAASPQPPAPAASTP